MLMPRIEILIHQFRGESIRYQPLSRIFSTGYVGVAATFCAFSNHSTSQNDRSGANYDVVVCSSQRPWA